MDCKIVIDFEQEVTKGTNKNLRYLLLGRIFVDVAILLSLTPCFSEVLKADHSS